MRNFKLDIKSELGEFIKEFRPLMEKFYKLQAEHDILSKEHGEHGRHQNGG
jgi:hypothetical protein